MALASSDPITVLVAEDEPDARLLLEYQLGLEEDIEVIATAGNGIEAVEGWRTYDPDVVVMDLLMPSMNGLEAIAEILKEDPEVGIVAVTAVAGEIVRGRTEALGVELVLKSGDPDEMLAAVRKVARPNRTGDVPDTGTVTGTYRES
jgi:two-component system, NarL family, nitrate/nitrite response regulator NarL